MASVADGGQDGVRQHREREDTEQQTEREEQPVIARQVHEVFGTRIVVGRQWAEHVTNVCLSRPLLR